MSSRILRTLPVWRGAIRQPAISRAFLSTQTAKAASSSAMVKTDLVRPLSVVNFMHSTCSSFLQKAIPSQPSQKLEAPKWGQLPPSAQVCDRLTRASPHQSLLLSPKSILELTKHLSVRHDSSCRCYAPARTLLFCQRDRHGLHLPPGHDLPFIKIHPTPEGAAIPGSTVY